jgi:hypothetical protein
MESRERLPLTFRNLRPPTEVPRQSSASRHACPALQKAATLFPADAKRPKAGAWPVIPEAIDTGLDRRRHRWGSQLSGMDPPEVAT